MAPKSHSPRIYFTLGERDTAVIRARRLIREHIITLNEITCVEPVPDKNICVIIPARNEATTIAAVIKECLHYASDILVVEGGSHDDTVAIARAAGARVVHDSGKGKGAALRYAVQHVTKPICVFIDADGSHDPIDIPMLVAPIKKGLADQAQGSRLLGGSDELHGGWDEFFRLTGSAFITCLVNMRFGVRISDSQNGFRAIKTSVFRSLPLRSKHTTIEMELVMASLAQGYTLTEIPTHERPRAGGFSKISLSKPSTWFSYGWTLLRGLTQRRYSRPTVVNSGALVAIESATTS
jgi:dolichol-phosphate hexosyltransferase